MQLDEPIAFLKRFLPIPGNLEKEDPIAAEGTNQFKFRSQILTKFQRTTDMTFQLAQSRYAMLQAVTYSYDHEKLTPSKDRGMIAWDGIVGNRAQKKAEALELLTNVEAFTM
jgi:hypothetical protein